MNDKKSLSHTKWNCKYHIVFAPEYRRKIIYGQLKVEVGKILRQLCEWKEVTIIEAHLCPDHIHMLVEIPRKSLFNIRITRFLKSPEGRTKKQLTKARVEASNPTQFFQSKRHIKPTERAFQGVHT